MTSGEDPRDLANRVKQNSAALVPPGQYLTAKGRLLGWVGPGLYDTAWIDVGDLLDDGTPPASGIAIGDLPAATTPLDGTELVVVVQAGVTSQATAQDIADLGGGGGGGGFPVTEDDTNATALLNLLAPGGGYSELVSTLTRDDSTAFAGNAFIVNHGLSAAQLVISETLVGSTAQEGVAAGNGTAEFQWSVTNDASVTGVMQLASATGGGSAWAIATDEISFFGASGSTQQPTPVNLADVIALLQAYGLSA